MRDTGLQSPGKMSNDPTNDEVVLFRENNWAAKANSGYILHTEIELMIMDENQSEAFI